MLLTSSIAREFRTKFALVRADQVSLNVVDNISRIYLQCDISPKEYFGWLGWEINWPCALDVFTEIASSFFLRFIS